MDITTIQGAIGSLKLASDIAKSIIEAKSISDVQGKVIELQSAILSAQSSALAAQSEHSVAINEISALKKEMADIKAWESEKQRYALYSPWAGAFVYALKESMSKSEPPHWICAHCYEDGERRILQHDDESGFIHLFCPKCKTKLSSGKRAIDSAAYV